MNVTGEQFSIVLVWFGYICEQRGGDIELHPLCPAQMEHATRPTPRTHTHARTHTLTFAFGVRVVGHTCPHPADRLDPRTAKGANYSFVPGIDGSNSLPLTHHLGDITLRLRKVASAASAAAPTFIPVDGAAWAFFSSTWGPLSTMATPVTSTDPRVVASHDISEVVAATQLPANPNFSFPLKVVRSYAKPHASPVGGGVEIAFEITNMANESVELGAFSVSSANEFM
jgi:hypothetical protein